MLARRRRKSFIPAQYAAPLPSSKNQTPLTVTHSSEHDQELDSLLVGPIPVGVNKFVFEADPPNTSRIPGTDILGVTVILLSCSYDDREFVRVGYYVNNEYMDASMNEEPPAKPELEKIRRNILADKPRVTRFQIKWDSDESAPSEFPPEQPDVDNQEDDEGQYGAEELDEEGEDEPATLEAHDGEAQATAKVDDAAMEGVEGGVTKDDEDEDAGSEDLEAESEEDEDEDDLEEEEAAGEAEGPADDMDMDDTPAENDTVKNPAHQQVPDVMVH